MLSFGIEFERAFSIAFWSARFPPGSGPPSLAATMIARESFEKSLPRFASAAPFLCLIDDHLLCPDTRLLPQGLQEQLVDPRVVRQLRVEGREHDTALPDEHRMPLPLCQHLDVGADVLDPRRADEHAVQRRLLAGELELGLEARDLAPERVPAHDHVGEPEVGLVGAPVDGAAGEQDHPGARAQETAVEAAQRLLETGQLDELSDRRRLATGDDEPVEPVELRGPPDLDHLRAERAEHGGVLPDVALERED